MIFYIGHDWQSSEGEHRYGEDLQRALRELKRLADKLPNRVYVAAYATREKMLVLDSKAVVFGSANWLSNRRYQNSGRSIVVADSAIVSLKENRISSSVRSNSIV